MLTKFLIIDLLFYLSYCWLPIYFSEDSHQKASFLLGYGFVVLIFLPSSSLLGWLFKFIIKKIFMDSEGNSIFLFFFFIYQEFLVKKKILEYHFLQIKGIMLFEAILYVIIGILSCQDLSKRG